MLKIRHSIENFDTGHTEIKQTEPYIIFTIENEEFGVEAMKVVELVNYMTPLEIPHQFVNVQGMASYRGQIIPIVDLRKVFGLAPLKYDATAVTIVVESGCVFGITAEQVLDLDFIPITSIKKVNAFNLGEKTRYLKSVANLGERLVLLLDLDKMIETKPQPILEVPEQRVGLVNPSPSPDYLSESREPEDLRNLISKPEQEEAAPLANELESIFDQSELEEENEQPGPFSPNLGDGFQTVTVDDDQQHLSSESPGDGFLEPEPIVEILSELESDLAAESPKDLCQIETGAEIGTETKPTDVCLSDELIEDLLKELEAETRPNPNEASSGDSSQNFKADRIEAAGEKSDV